MGGPVSNTMIHTSGEKLTKHIAFSEEAVANGIPIKVSQKRYASWS